MDKMDDCRVGNCIYFCDIGMMNHKFIEMETEKMIVLDGFESALAANVRVQREKPGHVVYTYLDTLRLDERRQPHPIDPQQEREFYLAGAPVASCLFEWRAGNAGTRLPRP